jgi:hypothetical protein
MLICLIRTFRILRSIEIIKYVQHMVTAGLLLTNRRIKKGYKTLGSRYMLHRTVGCIRASMCDQGAIYTTTLTEHTCARLLLTFTLYFLFMVIEECLTPKLSVA